MAIFAYLYISALGLTRPYPSEAGDLNSWGKEKWRYKDQVMYKDNFGLIINKIIDYAITVLSWVVVPIQLITTFILGLLVSLSFGLLLWPLSLVWVVLFFLPLLGLSYLWERVTLIKPIIALIGIPLAILGTIFVCLMPSMGEIESRVVKLICCQSFPYSWRFQQFEKKKLNFEIDPELSVIAGRISKDKAINAYLEVLASEREYR